MPQEGAVFSPYFDSQIIPTRHWQPVECFCRVVMQVVCADIASQTGFQYQVPQAVRKSGMANQGGREGLNWFAV